LKSRDAEFLILIDFTLAVDRLGFEWDEHYKLYSYWLVKG